MLGFYRRECGARELLTREKRGLYLFILKFSKLLNKRPKSIISYLGGRTS